MRAALLAVFLWLAASAAYAQDVPTPADCANVITQIDIDACASNEYEVADRELNRVYGLVVESLEKADKGFAEIDTNYVGAVDALKIAQRTWIKFRDASCDLAGFEARGGTLEKTIYIGCQTELTQKRTTELQDLLNAEWLK